MRWDRPNGLDVIQALRLINAGRTLTGATSYDAFGMVGSQTGSSLSLGYTGQLTDPSTGLIDLRARELDPTLGRFLSADTVQPNAPGTQGYNLYAYVANNPTTWVDPSGHMSGEVAELLGMVGFEAALALLVSPELVGIVAVGVFVAVVIWAVVAILTCVLDAACLDRLQQQGHTVTQYGSAATAGAWSLGGAATRTAWHNFPQLPKAAICALGAAESMATAAAINGVTGNKTSASDYWFAAGIGCATGGSGSGGSGNVSDRSSKIKFTEAQLRDKFEHASDFGVTGNSNPANWERFRAALARFIDSPSTQIILGTYRGTKVTHYFDPASKLWVAVDMNGNFITGWKLSSFQERYLLTVGNVQ